MYLMWVIKMVRASLRDCEDTEQGTDSYRGPG